MNPKVSIIMATYNRERFIVETLLAIQKQSFTDWECLIIDDGGTDNTREVIADFILQDPRFRFEKRTEKNLKGLSGCRNLGLDFAVGDYIIFFDDDDIPHPQNLELCVKELENTEISFCRYIRHVFVNDFHYNFDYSKVYASFYIDKKDVFRMLSNELQFNSCSIMWRKSCFENNRFVETLTYAEDWELYSRIVSSGFSGISIDKCLFYGRKHIRSNTGEYDRNSPIRRKSYAEAALLVVKNLEEKQLLTYSLKKYFIAFSIDFREYYLFESIINSLELPKFEKLKWKIFYAVLPLLLKFHRKKKTLKMKLKLKF